MSKHKITWLRTPDEAHEVTFEFRRGAAPVIYPADNADPGYPDDVEVLAVTPGSVLLHDEAQEWLHTDGYSEAVAIALSDLESAREYAAELRRDVIREN